jgi:hypothetical protein
VSDKKPRKVVFCIPTVKRPYQAMLDSLKASIPSIVEAGWEEGMVTEIGCPYISAARATMLRKALDAKADVIVFIDHDVSWAPGDMLKLIETEGDVVAGTYRFKKDEEVYMGTVFDLDGAPLVRLKDGALKAQSVPAGFLKITRAAVNLFMDKYPELVYGETCHPHIDLFNHGVHDKVWWGEDYSFCRRWREAGGDIWLVPDLNIDHNNADGTCFPGNFHQFLLRQPGGLNDPAKQPAQ